MYAQDDLTDKIHEIENSDGFNFMNAPDMFTYVEWVLTGALLPEYKYQHLADEGIQYNY
jgi:hypothetical protein